MSKAIEFIIGDMADQIRAEDPTAAAVLDHASSELIGLRNRLAAAFRKNRWYDALAAAGVDNWEGYEDAMRQIHEEESGHDDD